MTEAEFIRFLDDISSCFIARDFAGWESRVLLPFSLVTKTGPITLHTRDELRANFDLYLEACAIMQLDAIIRAPVSLEDCKDGTFIGTYETQLLSRGIRAADPYTSSALLHHTRDGWRMSSILNALGHHHWTEQRPNPMGDKR